MCYLETAKLQFRFTYTSRIIYGVYFPWFLISVIFDWNTEIPFHSDSFVSEKKIYFQKDHSFREPS